LSGEILKLCHLHVELGLGPQLFEYGFAQHATAFHQILEHAAIAHPSDMGSLHSLSRSWYELVLIEEVSAAERFQIHPEMVKLFAECPFPIRDGGFDRGLAGAFPEAITSIPGLIEPGKLEREGERSLAKSPVAGELAAIDPESDFGETLATYEINLILGSLKLVLEN
jgi:hypothetical protein